MKRSILKTAGVLGVLASCGFLVSASGLIPIKASSRHWAVTEWFLHFSMRRSVATHSLGVEHPNLQAPGLALRGATHYDIGCRSCHGSPADPHPRIAYQMTPLPPDLSGRVREWSPEQLFYLVKHGVKFTGMPAWPAQERDDEVWAVVAFLLELPKLDAAAYRERVGVARPLPAIEAMGLGEQAGQTVLQNCVRCHGADGLGRGEGAFPVLAGQRSEYMEKALLAYAEGRRLSGIMGPIAAALNPVVRRQLSEHYARQTPARPPESVADDAAVERGRVIAHEGIPKRRVPACVACHTIDGPETKPVYPLLAGQPSGYLRDQLGLFAARKRGGSDHAHIMSEIAPRLTEEQAADVAAYFAAQGGTRF